MKKSYNVIKIKGFQGIVLTSMVTCCLIAGFIIFPGWVGMSLWNLVAIYFTKLPLIGIIQGTLLWGIILAAYLAFSKDKLLIRYKEEVRGPSEEDIDALCEDIRHGLRTDPLFQALIAASKSMPDPLPQSYIDKFHEEYEKLKGASESNEEYEMLNESSGND